MNNLSKTQRDGAIASRMASRSRGLNLWLALVAMLVALPIFGGVVMAVVQSADDLDAGKAIACAAMPFAVAGGIAGGLRKEDEGGPDGGGALSQEEFQKGVLKTATQLKADLAEMTQAQKEAQEALTKVKNQNEGLISDYRDIQKALAQVKRANAGALIEKDGDPIRAIAQNEEKSAMIFTQVCKIAGRTVPDAVLERLPSDLKARALASDSTAGANFVDDGLSDDVYDTLSMFGKWNTLGVRRVGKLTTKFPVRTARPVAKWTGQSGTIGDDSTMAATQKPLTLGKIAVMIHVASELLEDADFDMASEVISQFVEAINYRLDFSVFQGTGADNVTEGEVTGLFNAGTGVTADTGRESVAALKYTDFLKCLTGVADVVLMRQAKWWIHPTMLAASLAVKDDNGRPIFQTALEAPSFGAVGSILGFPVELVSAAPNVDDEDSQIAAFGDPDAYIVAVGRDVNVATSEDFRFANDEVSFRGTMRAAGGIRRADGIAVLSTAASA